jgi:Skp family chaperone for outer membrane proteins
MAFRPSEKQTLLESLMDARRSGQIAEVSLRLQQKESDADKIRDANERLASEIDTLQGQLMQDWLAKASTVIADLGKRTDALDEAVDRIKKKVKVAENVTKAIGFLDDAVVIAKKALAGGL